MDRKEQWEKAAWLYRYFAKVGFFTFGGGWSIIAQMQKDFVEDLKWVDSGELLDKISVGRSLPGTMISNVALLFGYSLAGLPGALASVAGIVTAPVLVLSVLTYCYGLLRDNLYVARALVGVRAVVVPIMLVTSANLLKSAYPYKLCYCVTLAGFLLCTFTGVSNALVVLLGGLCGLAIMRWQRAQQPAALRANKEAKHHVH